MSAQPDFFREDDFARRKGLCRTFILVNGIADQPSGCTADFGPETYREYFERTYREPLDSVRNGKVLTPTTPREMTDAHANH